MLHGRERVLDRRRAAVAGGPGAACVPGRHGRSPVGVSAAGRPGPRPRGLPLYEGRARRPILVFVPNREPVFWRCSASPLIERHRRPGPQQRRSGDRRRRHAPAAHPGRVSADGGGAVEHLRPGLWRALDLPGSRRGRRVRRGRLGGDVPAPLTLVVRAGGWTARGQDQDGDHGPAITQFADGDLLAATDSRLHRLSSVALLERGRWDTRIPRYTDSMGLRGEHVAVANWRGPNIGFVSLSDGKIRRRAAGDQPRLIESDGAVYLVEASRAAVARVDPMEATIVPAFAAAGCIAVVAMAGDLWLLERRAGKRDTSTRARRFSLDGRISATSTCRPG